MLIALMMTVLIGFVALAVDSARAFDARRLLQDSVDAGSLAAAESFQYAPVWSSAQNNALTIFEKINRLPVGSQSCSPNTWGTPTPGSPATPVVTTCTISGSGGFVLTLAASDSGPAGQTFALSATRSLPVALMQVLGQSATVTLAAAAAATAGDQSVTPALAGISQAGCFGNPGTTPISVSSNTTLTVIGDVVSNGATSVASPTGYLRLAGDLLTRCGPPLITNPVTYLCWPGGATPPCAAGQVKGALRSIANHFADPGYFPPSLAGLVTQPNPLDNVTVSPGIYAIDPQFGTSRNACYFLAEGVYEWLSGMTVNGGQISNELKPPSEPGPNPPFWRLSAGNSCEGQLQVSAPSVSEGSGIRAGNWPVVVTSVRTAVYNGVNYTRESAPSACTQLTIPSGGDYAMAINISNVPGATSYNVYAAPPGATCAGPLGLVGSITNSVVEKTTTLSGCPNPSGSASCTLGAVSAPPFTNTTLPISWAPSGAAAPDTLKAYPPDPQSTADFLGGATYPAANHSRAPYPSGDRANENLCASAAGTETTCPAAVTPGAVVMYPTNGTCINVSGTGDAFLFSGYQYNWLLNHEPLATTCANSWAGRFNSALIGMTYTPGASFRFTGAYASQTNSFGGVVAGSILVQNAGNLTLYYNSGYAPHPPGTRLTG